MTRHSCGGPPAIALGSESPNPASYLIWDDQRDGATNSNIYYSKRSAGTGLWSTPKLKVNDGTGNTNERNIYPPP